MVRTTRTLRLALGGCLAATGFVSAPAAHADCAGVRADTPHTETKADGSVVIKGYGGGVICASGATASVCLDYNGLTRVDSCRTYTGTAPEGPSGEVICLDGLWLTQVVVIPNTGAPTTVHSVPPLIQVTCPIVDT